MTIVVYVAAYLAALFLAVHLATCAIAAQRCRWRAPCKAASDAPPITLVRPLCGLEAHARETLEASFLLDYPRFELLFCVADRNDPVIGLVKDAMARHPGVEARLLIGDDPISGNPKLNNMVKGWREARYDRTVFADSNLLLPADYLTRIESSWGDDVGLVSAPPIGFAADGDFWSELECAFLNSYEARWQYCADVFGMGFAQGKTLYFHRSLIPGGIKALTCDPAEDSATTKIVRKIGRRVVLARPPFLQPLARRSFHDVWARQCRWACLRKMSFPHLFALEILTNCLIPFLCVAIALRGAGPALVGALAAYALVWFGAEVLLVAVCGWNLNGKAVAAMILRDALLPALWLRGLSGRRYIWKGQAIEAAAGGASALVRD